ncbi:NAD-dependent epimerase/dehydratase family protein, partial [Campylobacter jejuni]|nr:NAD-dependent epimerase/dehydratase family protein [Campylobacter jejuni]
AFSKLMMDKLAKKYYDKAHLVGLRYFNVYGKGEFYKNKTASMVLQFGHQLAGKNPCLFEGSDQIYRDFTYIKDVISANLIALDSKCGVYN